MPLLAPENTPTSFSTFGSLQDAVAERLRGIILNGPLRPGDRLRPEELAKSFGVSATPIREALRQLQTEGFVVFHPRRGAMVAKLSFSEYEEIYLIREELETLAFRLAAQHFERIPIDRLKNLLAEIEVAETTLDVPQRLQVLREFFFTIFRASQKEHLLRLLSIEWDLCQPYRRHFSSIPEIVPQRLQNYRNIYLACEARNPHALEKALRGLHAYVRSTLFPLVHDEEYAEQ